MIAHEDREPYTHRNDKERRKGRNVIKEGESVAKFGIPERSRACNQEPQGRTVPAVHS